MPVDMAKESGDLVVVRISEKFTAEEMTRVQNTAIEMLKTQASLRVLALLEGFEGWEKGEGWDDMTFLMTAADKITRMAFVGEPRWKEEIYMFTGKGLRATEIEFFGAEADARAWLDRPSETGGL